MRALSVGLEVTNPGLDGSASFDGGFVLYDDVNPALDAPPTSDGGFALYDDINPGLDAEGRLRPGFVTCARTHSLG